MGIDQQGGNVHTSNNVYHMHVVNVIEYFYIHGTTQTNLSTSDPTQCKLDKQKDIKGGLPPIYLSGISLIFDPQPD